MAIGMDYLPRIVDDELAQLLEASRAVLIQGPKACGKTTTAIRTAASKVLLDIDDNARRMIDVDPRVVLEGDAPRLIDEWQVEPAIWNHVRRMVDRRSRSGQFILTGYAVPADDTTRHTGAGRFTRLRMRPLSLFGAGHSSGEMSLQWLLDGEGQRALRSDLSIASIAELVCAGGWPGNTGKSLGAALRMNRGYLDEICRVDISRVSEKRRDPVKVASLLRSLARNVATPVAMAKLAGDVGRDGEALKAETVAQYLEAMERLKLVEDQPAWSPHLKSRTTLQTMPVRHFADPALATAALRATPARLSSDLEFLALLFESMVIRDLRIYAQAADVHVLHYRENKGL